MDTVVLTIMTATSTAPLSGQEFLELLKKGQTSSVRDGQRVVGEYDITIDLNKLPEPETSGNDATIYIANFVFYGKVTFRNLKEGKFDVGLIHLARCHFQKGLEFEHCEVGRICVSDCTSRFITSLLGKASIVSISGVRVERELDLSGFEISPVIESFASRLFLVDTEYGEIEIYNCRTGDFLKTPQVRTDDSVLALMAHMARIPVYMSCESAKMMMRSFGDSPQRFAGA